MVSRMRSHSVRKKRAWSGYLSSTALLTNPLAARGLPSLVRNSSHQCCQCSPRSAASSPSQSSILPARSAHCLAPSFCTISAASRSSRSDCQLIAVATISASVAAVTPSARRCASPIVSPIAIAAWRRGRSACSAPTWRPNCSAETNPANSSNAVRRSGVLACASMVSRASVSASSASRSSTSWKCGDSAASNGKRRSSDWQNAWMVPIRMPPGRSSTVANNARALCSASPLGSTRSARSSCESAASSSVTQRPSVFRSRTDISAAAALVKVRHWMRSGFAPASISRSRRSVSSLVLPDPAEAPTKAETPGSDAWSCSALARSRAEVLEPPLTLHPPPPATPPRGQAAYSRRTVAQIPAPVATGNSGLARHTSQSARTTSRAPW